MLKKGVLMAKYFILAVFVCFFTSSAVYSLRDIDEYVLNNCGSDCNGEGPNCQECYNTAVDLFDQDNPDSPEMDFDLNYNEGTLDLTF